LRPELIVKWYLWILVGHGEDEGVDALVKVVGGDLFDELFGLDSAFIIGGEEELDDGGELHVHDCFMIENYMNWRGLGIKIMEGHLKMSKVSENGRVIKWGKMVGKGQDFEVEMVIKGIIKRECKRMARVIRKRSCKMWREIKTKYRSG
jgi:hypothetical protein